MKEPKRPDIPDLEGWLDRIADQLLPPLYDSIRSKGRPALVWELGVAVSRKALFDADDSKARVWRAWKDKDTLHLADAAAARWADRHAKEIVR